MTIIRKAGLAARLLARGDCLAVENGRLVLESAKGISIPPEWLTEHRDQLISDILEEIEVDAFTYDGYSTGNYGEHRSAGVTLNFTSLLAGQSAYAIFNVELTRTRNTKHGKRGKRLPKGKFRLLKAGDLAKLLKSFGIAPRSLSEGHESLPSLKGLIITADYLRGEKIDNKTISLLNLTYAQLVKAFQEDKVVGNLAAIPREKLGNSPGICLGKETTRSHIQNVPPLIPGTGANNYDKKVIREKITGDPLPQSVVVISPENQSRAAWLAELGSCEAIN